MWTVLYLRALLLNQSFHGYLFFVFFLFRLFTGLLLLFDV